MNEGVTLFIFLPFTENIAQRNRSNSELSTFASQIQEDLFLSLLTSSGIHMELLNKNTATIIFSTENLLLKMSFSPHFIAVQVSCAASL